MKKFEEVLRAVKEKEIETKQLKEAFEKCKPKTDYERSTMELNELREQLRKVCPHQKTTKKTQHYSGSYLNTGHYEHHWWCDDCWDLVKTETESDGQYG